MARRGNNDPKLLDDLFGFLKTMPVWVGPIVAVLVYVGVRWGIPRAFVLSEDPTKLTMIGDVLTIIVPPVSWVLAIGAILIWVVAEVAKWQDRSGLGDQSGLATATEYDSSPNASRAAPPACPECDSVMVIRTTRKGPKAGVQFYGCTRYPACRGTREIGATAIHK